MQAQVLEGDLNFLCNCVICKNMQKYVEFHYIGTNFQKVISTFCVIL